MGREDQAKVSTADKIFAFEKVGPETKVISFLQK
jgi:hypothetical protein